MANENSEVVIQNEPVIVEEEVGTDPNIMGDNNISSVSGNRTIIMVIISISITLIVYMLFFKKSNKEDNLIDPTTLIREDKSGAVNRSNFEDIESVLDNKNDTNNFNVVDETRGLVGNVANENLNNLELPTLSEDLKLDISQEVESEIARDEENYFTKEQVDALISDKLKNFEEQMNSLKSESMKLADKLKQKEIEEQNKEKAEKEKKDKENKIIGNLIIAPGKKEAKQAGTEKDLFSDDGIFSDTALKEEDEKKKQEEELKIAQRNRVLAERKASPMFKMQGGGGGPSVMEQENIIIMDKNLLIDIKDNNSAVIPTKTPDLSRTVLQGKAIDAVLETAIDTDVQSQVRAIITRDIYAEYGKNILIPKGSRVVGTFTSQASAGVSRVGIVWNRIIRVDGLSLNISATATDQLGRGGVDGDLDNKYFQIMRNAFLASLLTIATNVVVDEVSESGGLNVDYDKANNTTTYSGDSTAFAVREATTDFMDEAKDVIDKMKEEKPTVRIAQGTKILIMVNQDLNLPIYKKK